jgi:hypothetical protein
MGKICLRIKSDNNMFLINIKNPKKLKKSGLMSDFPNITRERRKRNLEHSNLEDIIMDEQEARGMPITQKTIKPDPNTIGFSKGEGHREFNLPTGKTLHGNFYRDIALVQFCNLRNQSDENDIGHRAHTPFIPKILKPVSDYEFLKIMGQRPNAEFWKGVDFIQT